MVMVGDSKRMALDLPGGNKLMVPVSEEPISPFAFLYKGESYYISGKDLLSYEEAWAQASMVNSYVSNTEEEETGE